jgi:putative colanic acid biosynthesis acetyltransferase WcaF
MQKLNNTVNWPYPKRDYFLRVLWTIVYYTLWQVAWHRIYFLRAAILKLFGANVTWKMVAFNSTRVLRPWDLKLGNYVTLGPRVRIYNLNRIEIAENTVISQDVYLCGGTHDYTLPSLPLLRKDIIIGNSVWIAAGAFIGPGITIGEGSVVGARSVVLKDVEPWTIVGGNPAKFIKKRKLTD